MALSRAQYDEAMRILSHRRQEALRSSGDRQEELERALPASAYLRDRIRDMAMSEARLRLSGRSGEADELAGERARCVAEREALMREAGYPADFESASFFCEKCHDLGYIDGAKCGCLKAIESELLLSSSGIPSYMSEGGLNSVDTSFYDDSAALSELRPRRVTQSVYISSYILPELTRFLSEFGTSCKNSILMYGPAGTGKTFLAVKLARELIDRQYSVVYQRAGDMFDRMSRAQFGRGEPDRGELEESLSGAEVLILDDLGTEFGTEFSRSRLFGLVSDRLDRGLATIITTNMSLKGLKEVYSERISSRLMGGYLVIPFYGPDLRIERGTK